MGRISDRFAQLKKQGHKALVAYIMGGDPDLETTEAIVPYLAELGVDLVEIGVPFSDPLADGPTIQEAGQRALKTTLRDLVGMVKRLRKRVEIPLLLMTYYNPVLRYGVEPFARDAAKAGVDGLIIPDLIPEEAEQLLEQSRQQGLDIVWLLAPTSSDRRMDLIASLSRGFLYYVSRTGTTGAREDIAGDLESNLHRVRSRSKLPIAVGFGISNPEQAARVGQHADGVVIGSAIVKRMADSGGDLARMRQRLAEFLGPIVNRLHSA